MEAAQTKLWRAVRREVSRASRVGPSDSSAASVSSGDDAGLSPEFVAAAHAVNAALARAVADEVEEQLTDVLMCLGEESTKARILEHALTRFDVHVPSLLREAGYSPGNSPPGSRGASPAARDAAARDAPFSWDGAGDGAGDGDGSPALYAHLLPPDTWRGGERGPSFAKSARNEDVSPEPGLAALRALSASRGFSSSVERTAFQTETPGGTASTGSALGLDGHRGSGEPPSPVEAVAAEARASATAASFDRAEAARRKNRGDDDDDDDDDDVNVNANANADAIAATHTVRRENEANAAGLGTPPEEEGARPASISEDWDTSEEEDAEEDLGYSSFSSESSRGGPRANRRAAYVTDAPEDVRAVSRRARQRARARLEVGPGVGPNILEGYYGGDSVFFPREETVARGVVPARRWDGSRRRARRAAGAHEHASAPEALDGDLRVHVLDVRGTEVECSLRREPPAPRRFTKKRHRVRSMPTRCVVGNDASTSVLLKKHPDARSSAFGRTPRDAREVVRTRVGRRAPRACRARSFGSRSRPRREGRCGFPTSPCVWSPPPPRRLRKGWTW